MTVFTAVRAEFFKLRRVAITWAMAAVMVAAAVVLNLFMWIAGNPGMAASLGLLGQKATISFGGQAPSWPVLLATLREMGGIGSILLASFILAWLFGREYLLGTAKNLLTLPVPRWWHVAAKSAVSLVWLQALLILLMLGMMAGGALQGLPGWDPAAAKAAAADVLGLGLAGWAAALPVAWVAVKSRGVYAPLGYAIGTVLMATMFGNLGWGPFVPWAILAIASGAAGPDAALSPASWPIVAATAVAGLALTIHHQYRVDNTQ